MAHSGISDAVMANVLNVQAQDSIIQLAAAGWPIRRISRHLGLDRKTIRRYLRHPPDPDAPPPDPKSPTISTAGNKAASGLVTASLATGFPAGPRPVPPAVADPNAGFGIVVSTEGQ
jgi:hypothetical protein